MAPSRGLPSLSRTRIPASRPQLRRYSDFVRAATNSSSKSQVYISRSLDPYLNLSIEHYLLQKTPADSTVLFLYTNRPCVVIGRNQNPWIEVNLGILRNEELRVKLVRRRSGGGTVFHDEGNVNYSVICPTPAFNRDKHAEMVVRALNKLGVEKARVNERHDIVVDKEDEEGEGALKQFKVSGSAYKLTRLRSLHHGTCLLSSPNLEAIWRYLRAPAKLFIKARGVDSVSSPITNVGISNESFEEAVISEFRSMYDSGQALVVSEAEKEVPEIAKGREELMSEDWIYCQTPQFTFSTEGTATTASSQPKKRAWSFLLHGFKAEFTAKHGKITELLVKYDGQVEDESFVKSTFLLNREIHKITDWVEVFPSSLNGSRRIHVEDHGEKLLTPGRVMNELFGAGNYSPSEYLRA